MFTENFVQLLQERNIRPYHIAKATGISAGAMAEYATGKKKPSIENLVKIADFLDVSTDELLGRDTSRQMVSTNLDREMYLLQLFRSISFADQMKEIGRLEILAEMADKKERSCI